MDVLQLTVQDVLSPNTSLILLKQDYSIADSLNVLSMHGILSAPVYDIDGRLVLGQVDVLDILTFVLEVNTHTPHWTEEMQKRFNRPVGEAIDSSMIDPFFPVPSSSSLSDVLRNLFSYGIHRVPVVDSSGEIKGILSQSNVIEYIANCLDLKEDIEALLNMTVQELDLAPGKLTSVTDDCALLHAFTVIMGTDISAVPIVKSIDGSLVGTLSASDFKGVHQNNLPVLTNPVRDFMTTEPLTCTLSTPLRDIIDTFAQTGVHRLFVVQGNPKKPIGVVSMTDVLKVLANRLC